MDIAFEQKIRQRAYEIWASAGGGDPQSDWLAAERAVRNESAMGDAKPVTSKAAAEKLSAGKTLKGKTLKAATLETKTAPADAKTPGARKRQAQA